MGTCCGNGCADRLKAVNSSEMDKNSLFFICSLYVLIILAAKVQIKDGKMHTFWALISQNNQY